MEPWLREVIELHEFFEGYFLGTLPADQVGRVADALAESFEIINPEGALSNRDQVVAAIRAGHGHTDSLAITITEPKLLVESDTSLTARYIENHELANGSNHRWSTVVFCKDSNGPNGLRWVSVHETWVANTRS